MENGGSSRVVSLAGVPVFAVLGIVPYVKDTNILSSSGAHSLGLSALSAASDGDFLSSGSKSLSLSLSKSTP